MVFEWHLSMWQACWSETSSRSRDEVLAITVEATCAASNRAFFGVLKMHRPSVRSVPLLWDGVAWRVCDSDLVDLLPSERRHTRRVWAGTRQRTTDVLARHQEHRALLFIEREPRANNALAAASRVVQMNSTMLLLGRAGAR